MTDIQDGRLFLCVRRGLRLWQPRLPQPARIKMVRFNAGTAQSLEGGALLAKVVRRHCRNPSTG